MAEAQASSPLRAASIGVYGLVACVIAVLFVTGFADGRPVMRDLNWATALSHPRALAVSPKRTHPFRSRVGSARYGSGTHIANGLRTTRDSP